MGAVLLLVLPEGAFEVVVPVLVALAVILVAVQPLIAKKVGAPERGGRKARGGPLLFGLIFVTGVYGGYFGAAQGVLLLGIMGLMLSDSLQELNAIKNVLAGLVNAVAALIFIFVADPAWEAVALIAVGATIGGAAGAKVARRLPPNVLRGVVVVVGLAAFVQLVPRAEVVRTILPAVSPVQHGLTPRAASASASSAPIWGLMPACWQNARRSASSSLVPMVEPTIRASGGRRPAAAHRRRRRRWWHPRRRPCRPASGT